MLVAPLGCSVAIALTITCPCTCRSGRIREEHYAEEYIPHSVFSILHRLNAGVLTDFQLTFSPSHFRSEKLAWRTIVQLNLIR